MTPTAAEVAADPFDDVDTTLTSSQYTSCGLLNINMPIPPSHAK